jgi:hypothetical protein
VSSTEEEAGGGRRRPKGHLHLHASEVGGQRVAEQRRRREEGGGELAGGWLPPLWIGTRALAGRRPPLLLTVTEREGQSGRDDRE